MWKRYSASVEVQMSATKGCPHCGADLHIKPKPFSMEGIYFGEFKAFACETCGRHYFGKEASLKIEQIAKRKGLWGKVLAPKRRAKGRTRPSPKRAVPQK